MQNDLVQDAFNAFEKAAEGLVIKVAKESKNAGSAIPNAINALGSVCVAVRNVLAIAVANHDLHLSEQDKILREGNYTRKQLASGDIPPEVKAAIDRFKPEHGVTKESILFAALLTVRMSPERDHKNETVPVEFSPMVVLDAMDDYEKLTGKRPDPFLNQGMAASARKNEGIGRDVFAKFAEAHKNNPGLPNTLN